LYERAAFTGTPVREGFRAHGLKHPSDPLHGVRRAPRREHTEIEGPQKDAMTTTADDDNETTVEALKARVDELRASLVELAKLCDKIENDEVRLRCVEKLGKTVVKMRDSFSSGDADFQKFCDELGLKKLDHSGEEQS
jgi:hypothetical protein